MTLAARPKAATTAERRERARGRGGRGAGRPPGEPRRIGWLYALPALLVYAAFLIWPLLHGAYFSLFEWDGLSPGTWTGLSNYSKALSDPTLRGAFLHALVLVVFYAVVPCCIAFVLVAAMSRSKIRGLTFFRTVLFLPQVVAMVAVAVAWQWIYSPGGPINDVLRWLHGLGLPDWSRGWLGDFTWALPAVGLIGTWVQIGLAMVLFMAGVQKIPRELYEAARIDGAGPVREFLAVTLPGLRRELAVALTLTTIAAMRNFDLIYLATSGGPGDATKVPAYEVYNRTFNTGEVGLASAIGIIIAVLIFTFTVLIGRFVEGRDR
ncbi:carbohydrate ABC transporter permease [Thermomonospora umbrina]|uniref:Raffinose/stachyose/melibiose transport system permease protein n=1 Tax=Thermomonospora umbrina TaxID=111806 RepID=A0A3D9SY27_9ACTN|nr:sugar ABC transporter permease [Thermomonospora umbrina]REF00873.1 raffinose/stachyose/melibiose transport system permease protein [Thermomonospora umbrina]